MFKTLGKLKNIEKKQSFKIDINQLKSEINLFENFIIFKKGNDIRVYDRICNHAG